MDTTTDAIKDCPAKPKPSHEELVERAVIALEKLADAHEGFNNLLHEVANGWVTLPLEISGSLRLEDRKQEKRQAK